MESHARDLDNYVNVARNRRRRAKALLDFERHDDDELGFRKNDIITVRCCLLFWLAFYTYRRENNVRGVYIRLVTILSISCLHL